jgi:hypothetical protein
LPVLLRGKAASVHDAEFLGHLVAGQLLAAASLERFGVGIGAVA